MKASIFDSIINGTLSPLTAEQKSVPMSEISQKLRKLPTDLQQLEILLTAQLGQYVDFSFDEEKACPLNLAGDEYHPLPEYRYPVNIQIFASIDDTPEHRFYSQIIEAEALRLKLALAEFSSTAKADIDTRGEIERTLEGIYHLSLQLKNVLHGQVIKYYLKQQMIRLYYEIAYTYGYLFQEDRICPFDDYYFKIFGSYPAEEVSSAFKSTELQAHIQHCILSKDQDIDTHMDMLKQSLIFSQLKDISIWLSNYIFTEVFCINASFRIDTERGSRELYRFFCEQHKSSYGKAQSKSELIASIETDIESADSLCIDSTIMTAASLTREWLSQQLHSAESTPGDHISNDVSIKNGLKYKYLATKPAQIKDLYIFLVKEGKIENETDFTNFRRVFIGDFATTPIKWTGALTELMSMFKQMKNDGVFTSNEHIWENVCKSFIRPDGSSLTPKQIAAQHPTSAHKDFAIRASRLLSS